MTWTVIQAKDGSGWAAEKIHDDDEGRCSRALFMGKDDEELARSFADLAQIDREELADFYKWKSGTAVHSNLCATSIAPAMFPGHCDCDVGTHEPSRRRAL